MTQNLFEMLQEVPDDNWRDPNFFDTFVGHLESDYFKFETTTEVLSEDIAEVTDIPSLPREYDLSFEALDELLFVAFLHRKVPDSLWMSYDRYNELTDAPPLDADGKPTLIVLEDAQVKPGSNAVLARYRGLDVFVCSVNTDDYPEGADILVADSRGNLVAFTEKIDPTPPQEKPVIRRSQWDILKTEDILKASQE